MFGRIGPMEILIIVFILVFLFGAKKIPELARGMGKGINEFKKGLNEAVSEDEAAPSDDRKEKGED